MYTVSLWGEKMGYFLGGEFLSLAPVQHLSPVLVGGSLLLVLLQKQVVQ